MIDNSKQRKLGAILSYLNILIATAVGILYTPFLLRALGQSEYGLYSLILALMSFLAILDLGFGNSIVRFNAKLRALKDDQGIARLNGLFVILYSAMAIIALGIGYFIYQDFDVFIGDSLTADEAARAKIMFTILIVNLAFTLFMSIYNSLLIAYEKFVIVQTFALFRTLLMPIIMTPLLLFGYGSIALVVVNVSLNVIVLLGAAMYCYTNLKVKITFTGLDYGLFKDISTYSFFILLNILVDKLYAPTSQYILGVTTGTTAVAVYAIGIQFTTYFTMLSTSINSVFLPKITQLVVEEKFKEISNVFIKTGRIQFIILAFVLSGFILFGQEFIKLWAGPEYVNSYIIALIIMVPSIIPLSQNMAIVILQARNQLKFRVLVYLIIAIVSVGLSYYLSNLWLEIGPAISVATATLLGQILIMNYYYFKKVQLDIPQYWKQVLPITCRMALMMGVFYMFYRMIIVEYSWGNLALSVFVYSLITFFYMYKRIMNDYERGLFSGVIKRVYLKRGLK
ncbi:MAG: oligosaccharide flippase family protein [Solibacillus sp.]